MIIIIRDIQFRRWKIFGYLPPFTNTAPVCVVLSGHISVTVESALND
jgi:hypothetical protein